MKKENKVISLDLAKRLHALGGLKGVESEWWWNCKADECYISNGEKSVFGNGQKVKFYPAYDTAELGEWLPAECVSGKTENEEVKNGKWICGHTLENEGYFEGYCEFADTEPEARGLMAEYLIKNKLV